MLGMSFGSISNADMSFSRSIVTAELFLLSSWREVLVDILSCSSLGNCSVEQLLVEGRLWDWHSLRSMLVCLVSQGILFNCIWRTINRKWYRRMTVFMSIQYVKVSQLHLCIHGFPHSDFHVACNGNIHLWLSLWGVLLVCTLHKTYVIFRKLAIEKKKGWPQGFLFLVFTIDRDKLPQGLV